MLRRLFCRHLFEIILPRVQDLRVEEMAKTTSCHLLFLIRGLLASVVVVERARWVLPRASPARNNGVPAPRNATILRPRPNSPSQGCTSGCTHRVPHFHVQRRGL